MCEVKREEDPFQNIQIFLDLQDDAPRPYFRCLCHYHLCVSSGCFVLLQIGSSVFYLIIGHSAAHVWNYVAHVYI